MEEKFLETYLRRPTEKGGFMEEKFFKAGKTVGGFIKTLLLPAILSVVMAICTKILSTRMSDIVKDYIEVIKSPLKKGE